MTYVGVLKLPTYSVCPLAIPESCANNIGLQLPRKIIIIYRGLSNNLSVIKNGVNSLCWTRSVWYVNVFE